MLFVCSRVGNEEETVVVEDIAAIARRAFGAIADPYENGALFVGGITARIGLFANAASSIFVNSTKPVVRNSPGMRKVDDSALVAIGSME